MTRIVYFRTLYFLVLASCASAAEPPEPFGPLPTEHHLRWHEMEYYGFIHFTVNTFTDKEWGYGDESPQAFNPTDLAPAQWAAVAKQAGMKALIITAKHHDGFCLWPSEYTEHSLKNSPWKNGKGDLVAELAAACKANDLRLGVYLSPWDRNHPDYGTPKYIEYYRNQLRELLTGYGDICEVWFDGANGGDGFYGGARETRHIDRSTYYDWPNTWKVVRDLQPMAVMFSDGGPDIRWVGNESGEGSGTNWALLRRDEFAPGIAERKSLLQGQSDGTHWVPAEVDVSIRPGWFYHADQDAKVRSVDNLMKIYYSSIGNGCNLLLNIPPDQRGRFHEIDCQRLIDFKKARDAIFDVDLAKGKQASASETRGDDPQFSASKLTDGDRNSYWAANDDVRNCELTVELGEPTKLNHIRVQEYIQLGQRIEEFAVDARVDGKWQQVAAGTTIGPRKIIRTPTVTADAVRMRIINSRACPTISTLELYRGPDADTESIGKSKKPPTNSMMADSPVTFPDKGALPSKYPTDVKVDRQVPEEGYSISGSPARSLEQIAAIQNEMPMGTFTAPPTDWKPLSRTREILTDGGELHIVGLGDSIVNDTFRSGWLAKLAEAYPQATIRGSVYVRGGGGCKHYRHEGRVQKHLVPLKPDLVFIGGISQGRDYEAIRDVIGQLRRQLPKVEILLATGAFGTVDPRRDDVLGSAQASGSSEYGKELKKIANELNCAYLDMTTPWAQYIRSAGVHPHLFYRDRVHANAEGEQILSKILMSFLDPSR